MAINLTDKIAGGVRGSVAGAMQFARESNAYDLVFLLAFFTELYRLCVMFAWDFALMVAQSAHETANWAAWNTNWSGFHNPAGLAITNAENKSLTYKTGIDAARAFAVHMWVYLYGPLKPTDYLYQFRDLDGHYKEVAGGINEKKQGGDGKPFAASIVSLGDFNVNGRWALLDRINTPKGPLNDYGNRILGKAREVWPGLPDQGAVTAPPVEVPPVAKRDPYDLIRDYVRLAPVTKTEEGQGFNYGSRDIIGLVQHETQGIMGGYARQKFFSVGGERGLDAMVDYDVARDGWIYQFNDPFTSNMIPWASGGGKAGPNRNNPDGKAVDNRYGSRFGGVNSVYAAAEFEKDDTGFLNDDQIEAGARLTAFIAAMNDYPANDWKYPDSIGGDIPTSTDHDVISLGTNCEQQPSDRAKMEKRVPELLTAFYAGESVARGAVIGGGTGTDSGDPPTSGPSTPTYAPAAIVEALKPYMDADPNTVPPVIRAEGSDWIYVNDRVKVTRTTPRLQRASKTALRVGDDLKKGQDFTAKFMVKASTGDWYYLTAMFTRVQAADTSRSKDLP